MQNLSAISIQLQICLVSKVLLKIDVKIFSAGIVSLYLWVRCYLLVGNIISKHELSKA